MDHVAVDALDAAPSSSGADRRALSDVLGTDDVAINHHRVAPGDRVSGLHAHGDQEEVFLLVEGAVTFETYDAEAESAGTVTVAAGELVRFAPGEYQSAANDGDAPATVFAVGAPPDSEDLRIPFACPDCGNDFLRPTLASGDPMLACPDCGTETGVECPGCGGQDLLAALSEAGRPVSRCRDCGHESAGP